MDILYSGFDGLDLALKFNISDDFASYLEARQKGAEDARHDVCGEWSGQAFKVAATGGQGGYAFRIDTGLTGETWFLKRPTKRDPWGVRVSAKSAALLAHGLSGWQRKMEATALAFGAAPEPGTVSIGRVDLAVDFLAPDFILDDNAFVMPARSNRKSIKEIMQTNGRSGRLTSVTVGKMPGRQVIVYDKRDEVFSKGKVEWLAAWNARRAALGQPALDLANPAASRVWRVEVRAGKQHLKKQWGVTSWTDLGVVLPHLVAGMMEKVRYCDPSSDSNRARWPIHPLWAMATQTLTGLAADQLPCISAETIRTATKAEKIDFLLNQSLGALTSIAALEEISPLAFDGYLEILSKRLAVVSRHHRKDVARRLAEATERYSDLLEPTRQP
ncbi:hypothetical protein [Jannaschia ovalis]|uniref:Replication initiation factor n=1 Tax=Jannaschia ovalis TaxID=3038773 RepID=A0ABY8L7Y3_9RHOB|nr:hypothetical protein [Jannaschia sp. GRR-S6-38]WGH77482.1 hypothetical protein P8627_10555 [Jannaschia sp. GRR-S6-38]